MQRRDFIALLGGVFSWPFLAHAQQKAMPVVGFLVSFSLLKPGDRDPVREGMSEMGFVEGKNMMSESRWAELHYDRLPGLAAELVSRNVDVIGTIAGTLLARAAKNATSTIPILLAQVGDPVGARLVASLARPGGNVTGFNHITGELMAKRLELLCELVPQATVIAWLQNDARADHAGGGAREGSRASDLEGPDRRRDRRGFRLP